MRKKSFTYCLIPSAVTMSVVNLSVNHYIVSLSEACGVLWLPVLQTIKTPETLHSQTMEMAVEYLFRSTFSKNIFCLPCFTRHILFPETILASSCCSPQVLSTLAACRMSHSQSWRSVQGYWNAGGERTAESWGLLFGFKKTNTDAGVKSSAEIRK